MMKTFEHAEQALFDHVGLTVHRRTTGRTRLLEAGAGKPILYVHGGGGCGALWAPLAAEVARLGGRRHLMPDRPGFGGTPWVPLQGVDLRSHAVGFLTDLLDRLELGRVDIVANSMGGLWSLWLASAHPKRVRSLTLLGTPAFVGGTGAPLPMRLLGQPVIGRALMALEPPSARQVRTLWQRLGHEPQALHSTVHEVMLALEQLPSYAAAWRDLLGRCLRVSGARHDVVLSDEELAAIEVPVSIVWGTRDPFGEVAAGRRIADTCRASYRSVEGGHLPWLDDTVSCAKAVAARLGLPAAPEARRESLAS